MIDWQWIPGTVLGGGAVGYTAWLHSQFNRKVDAKIRAALDAIEAAAEDGLIGRLRREIDGQRQHALMLWPRAWQGGRQLTQVEEIVTDFSPGMSWENTLAPEEQQQQMQADTQRLLDSYKPPGVEDAGDS